MYVSRVLVASMRTMPCADNCLVRMDLIPACTQEGSAYWHFNNQMLEDCRFQDSFRQFWVKWRKRLRGFPFIKQWWAVGKAYICLFSQEYTRDLTKRRDAEIE